MIWRFVLFFIILALVLFTLIKAVDLSQLGELLIDFPRSSIAVLCFLSLLISFIKAWRFSFLLKNNQVKISFSQVLKVYFAGQATTPLPGGEALRSLLLKKEIGVRVSDTSAAVITQAFLEFSSAAILLVIGSFLLNLERVPAVIALFAVFLMGFFLTHPGALNKIVKFVNKVKRTKSFTDQIQEAQRDIRQNVFDKIFLRVLTLAILTNFLGGLMIYIIVIAYNLDLNFIQSTFVYCTSVVVSSLSGIIPAGFGFTEGGMIGVLLLSKVQLSEAIALVVIFRLINVIFYVLVGLIFLGLFYGHSFIRHGLEHKK